MRIEDALDRFMLQLEADGRSAHSIRQYHRHVRLFSAWAAQEPTVGDVEGISHEDLARFLAAPQALLRPDGRPKKPTSVNSLRSSLRGFFQYLHRAGLVKTDPSRMIRRALCGDPPPRTLSEEDQEALLATLAQATGTAARRDHALFLLLLRTGIRISSALAVEVGDVDLKRGEITLRRCKAGQVQRIFLPPDVIERISKFLGGRDSGWLFRGRGEGPITARHAQRRLTYWIAKSGGKQLSPHGLRHSFAMSFYRRCRDLSLVQKALGHRNIASTMRYARALDDDLREAMHRIEPAGAVP